MKVASIVPQNYLEYIENDDYLMCLGNLIGKKGMERYTQFFERKATEGKFIIMDNGLIENDPRPLSELVEKAHQLGVSEMVMPDVFMNKNATLAAIFNGLEEMRSAPMPRLMLVAQGSTVDEWVDCAHEIIRNVKGLDYTIGVPKVLVKLGGRDARANAIQKLLEVCPVARHMTFHLLGCWTTPLEITTIDRIATTTEGWPLIRGVDSAMPFVYARAAKRIDHDDRPDNEPINFECSYVDERYLRYNLKHWRAAADSSKQPFNLKALFIRDRFA